MNVWRSIDDRPRRARIGAIGGCKTAPVEDETTLVAERITPTKGPVPQVAFDVSRPVSVIDGDMEVGDVEVLFRDETLKSIAVDDRDKQLIGLVTRAHFAATMTGRLGYGRAVFMRKAVSQITDWRPLIVHSDAKISDVATRAMARQGMKRYDDILVEDATWRVAESADVTMALVSALAGRATLDPLTGLRTRASLWHTLSKRCDKAQGGKARIALILINVKGLRGIDALYGQNAGDTILKQIARRLERDRQPGCKIGRVDGDTFAVVATFEAMDEARIVANVDALSARILDSLRVSGGSVPQDVWPGFRVGVAWSSANAAVPDLLIRDAEARLASARAGTGRAGA